MGGVDRDVWVMMKRIYHQAITEMLAPHKAMMKRRFYHQVISLSLTSDDGKDEGPGNDARDKKLY